MDSSNSSNLRTAPQIAAQIGRAAQSVYRVIERLKIKPVITVSGIKIYDPVVIPQIKAAMRRPNYDTDSSSPE